MKKQNPKKKSELSIYANTESDDSILIKLDANVESPEIFGRISAGIMRLLIKSALNRYPKKAEKSKLLKGFVEILEAKERKWRNRTRLNYSEVE